MALTTGVIDVHNARICEGAGIDIDPVGMIDAIKGKVVAAVAYGSNYQGVGGKRIGNRGARPFEVIYGSEVLRVAALQAICAAAAIGVRHRNSSGVVAIGTHEVGIGPCRKQQ
jgi:hypothetical protein